MPKVRVAGFSVSLDGFSAGIEQSLSDPLGKRGTEIFQWFFRTKSFCAMHGQEVGVVDTDDEFARRALENSAPSSSVATCSVLCAAHGWTTHGKDGGATTHRIMRQPSF
jgi:hypothetical protein